MYQDILKYTKTVDHYNTHDFSVFLYSLIKMQRPKSVLELGTGFGVTSFLAAQACKENNKGHVTTIDNGLEWDQLTKYEHYMQHSIIRFDMGKHLEFINKDINCIFNIKIKPDILFNDVTCEPIFNLRLLEWLKDMKKECILIIDRGMMIAKEFKDYNLSIIKKDTNSLQNNFIMINVPKK